MIFFDACAVRAIVTVVTLLVGLSTPPILVDQTTNLLSCCGFSTDPELFIAPIDVWSLENQLSLTLEWTLLRPNRGQCAPDRSTKLLSKAAKVHNVESVFESVFVDAPLNLSDYEVHSSLVECVFDEQLPPVYSDLEQSPDNETILPLEWMATLALPQLIASVELMMESEIDLLPNTTDITVHLLPGLVSYSVTGYFETTSPQSQLISSRLEHLLEVDVAFPPTLDSGCLATLKQLRLYVRELILHSLPAHWAEWITHNRLTLSLMGVSLMSGSLLCPILYYLWTMTKTNECLTKDFTSLNGLKLCMESQLLSMTMERNALMETNCVHRKELKDTKTRLRQSQVLEIETSDEVALITKEMYLEQSDARRNMEHIKSEHAKAFTEVNRKLEDTKRQVSWYQIAECKAKMELASLKKQVEEERMERNNKQLSTSQLMTELQQDLRTTRRTLKGNLEATQQKLRLAADRALELKLRLADSVMNNSKLICKDSGIFEAWSN